VRDRAKGSAHARQHAKSDRYEEFLSRFQSGNQVPFCRTGATHEVTQDILTVGDVWATDLSPLELQNADTKRVAESSGARRLELSSSGQQIKHLRSGAEGTAKLVTSKGYSTTVALSGMNHLLVQGQLRRGDGLYQIPDSRRKERLMLHGRTKNASTGVKHENER